MLRRHTIFLVALLLVLSACGRSDGDPAAHPTTPVPSPAVTEPPVTEASVTEPPVATPPATAPPPTRVPATTAPAEATTDETPDEPAPEELRPTSPAEALALADQYYAALNAGDLDRAAQLGPIGLNRRTAVAGFGAVFEWECTAETGESVVCHERISDDFYGPAGLIHEGAVTYRVENAKLSGDADGCFTLEPRGEFLAYVQAFDRWLYGNHPETVGWIWLFEGEGLPNWIDGRPCRMYSVESDGAGPVIAGYATEFVAASPDWPRSD